MKPYRVIIGTHIKLFVYVYVVLPSKTSIESIEKIIITSSGEQSVSNERHERKALSYMYGITRALMKFCSMAHMGRGVQSGLQFPWKRARSLD